MKSSEEDFEDMVYNFLLENQGKAFTIVAIRKSVESINIDPHISEYSGSNLLTILKKMRDKGKIKLIQHDGKIYYFVPEIYNSAQGKGETQYFTPEVFISAETLMRKVKKKYCKRCEKEVTSMYRNAHYPWIKKISHAIFNFGGGESNQHFEARQNTGWFCPSCGNRIGSSKRDKKIFDKMKDLSNESLKSYIDKMKDRTSTSRRKERI